MSHRTAIARISRPDMRGARGSGTVRPLRRPAKEPVRQPDPKKESGVRRRVSTVPPAAAKFCPDALELVELVAADLSRDPRRDD